MTRVDPSGISDVIRAHGGNRAIAQENSSFFLPPLYHAAGSCQGWKQFHRTATGGELDKAIEAAWNEESDTTCSIGQSGSKSSHGAAAATGPNR